MVTVVDELFAALDSDPALLEAARARLLTREILELPQIVARISESLERLADSRTPAPGTAAALDASFEAFRAESDKRFAKVDSRFIKVDSRIGESNAENARLRGEVEEFRAEVNTRFDDVGRRIDETNARIDETNARIDETNVRIDETNVRIDETNARIDETNAELAKLRQEFEDFKEEVRARFDGIEARLNALTRDVGWIKGWVTRAEFDRNREDYIFGDTGLELVEVVTPPERREMMRKHGDMLGATEGERRSFVRADALARVKDKSGRDAYLAVEVSFTVHWQDTSRAVRNASFLTRMTGVQAYAAVAGTRVNKRSQAMVDSGEVLFIEVENYAPPEDDEDY